MEGVKLDMWGYEVRTSSDSCISAINSYYHQVLSYGRERSVILEALVHDKDCVLANILAASFLCSSDPSRAPSHIQAAKSLLEQATKYEKAVFDAVSYLISQDRDDDVAVELYFKLLKDFPRDLVSLKRAQVLCFYMARADLSLDLVQQVLPINQEENYIYGMLAFPLLELGKMADAEKAAKKGFEINKQDYWAQHALCHVLQYECHFKEAVEFMEGCSSSWSSCGSFMLTHNWWHVALCYLEGSSPIQRVLEIYDHCILKELERSDAACPEVYLNAVGLLLRLYVRGEIDAAGDRLKILAGCLTDEANWYIEWHFDCLILWALASTGELSKAEDLLKGLKFRFSRMSKKKQQLMHGGMLLAEALYEYGRGNDKEALQLLGPDFDANNCKVIGASDEQVDVFNEIWYSMLLNTGQAVKAIEVIEKRIKKREGVPFLWRLLERAYNLAGRKEAAIIGEKARALETSYFK
nr:tetratricopeptide repeat protein 38 [Quercus suber]POE90524.1 tetratricopeptide repeat protein 38 [Quercus suber]